MSSLFMPNPSHYEIVASELIAALRGRRSQKQVSQRLGYRSNIVQRWESRDCWPTASKFFTVCTRLGVDINGALARFYGRTPPWLTRGAPDTPQTVAAFLRDLRGTTPIGSLAEQAGLSRFAISRWLNGTCQPRLHQFLLMIDVTSHRLVDFVAQLVDPAKLPSLRTASRELALAREAAYATPWSHGVLRALELDDYQGEGAPRPRDELAWFSEKLGLEQGKTQEALTVIERSGQARRRRGRLVVNRVMHVNTGADPSRARQLKAFWAHVAAERAARGTPGHYGYSLFAVSREALRELREIQLRYVREMQAVISRSERSDCVGLYCSQLLDLSTGEDNALRTPPVKAQATPEP